jgi:6-phosphogluconate dehydrogenase
MDRFFEENEMQYKVGLVGLGVMGSNLALNIERNGFSMAVYNRNPEKTRAFLAGPAAGKQFRGVESPAELMAVLEKPRRILMMVTAGSAVDQLIEHLAPHLEPGDILMDGGNSLFVDTDRRNLDLESRGFNYIGMGVSGGEEGALWGPSIMPGGQRSAWEAVEPIFKAISAKAEDGEPCVDYMGPRGAGHYVKMIHNGIEYGDMQLIAETYDILHRGLGLTAPGLHEVFSDWNSGELQSFLIEITAQIFKKIDDKTGKPLVEMILDEAQQKGTGKWTSQNALDIGAPIPTINAAVESRILSALKPQRVNASKLISGPKPEFHGDRKALIKAAREALYASKITSYAQGMGLLKIASDEYRYELELDNIARIWRAGCIIRADLLNDITNAYRKNPGLVNLLLDDAFRQAVESRQQSWRLVVQTAVGMGIPVAAMGASLAYFDAYRSERLPANLTQAQRDFFGAHTYRRTDMEGVFHSEWAK